MQFLAFEEVKNSQKFCTVYWNHLLIRAIHLRWLATVNTFKKTHTKTAAKVMINEIDAVFEV